MTPGAVTARSDIAAARPGDVFTYDGVEWVVIGRHLGPVVMLRRRDVSTRLPVCERTDATVSPTSAWAWEWLPVDGGRTRAAEDIVGKQ